MLEWGFWGVFFRSNKNHQGQNCWLEERGKNTAVLLISLYDYSFRVHRDTSSDLQIYVFKQIKSHFLFAYRFSIGDKFAARPSGWLKRLVTADKTAFSISNKTRLEIKKKTTSAIFNASQCLYVLTSPHSVNLSIYLISKLFLSSPFSGCQWPLMQVGFPLMLCPVSCSLVLFKQGHISHSTAECEIVIGHRGTLTITDCLLKIMSTSPRTHSHSCQSDVFNHGTLALRTPNTRRTLMQIVHRHKVSLSQLILQLLADILLCWSARWNPAAKTAPEKPEHHQYKIAEWTYKHKCYPGWQCWTDKLIINKSVEKIN